MTSAPAENGTPNGRPARPIILTVDDDPGVSRAVARDLRRGFGQDYRILRADSGAAALEAIREVAAEQREVTA